MKANQPDYITVNGHRFACNAKLATETLFESGGTACGTYKASADGIHFYRLNGEPWFYLCTNCGDRFFVSTHRVNGRIRYMFALCSNDAASLGLEDYGHSRRCASETWDSLKAA